MANVRYTRGRGPRRRTEWAGFGNSTGAPVLPDMISLGAGTPAFLSKDAITRGVAAISTQEYTITRMLASLSMSMNVDTALAQATVAVGCGVASEDAIGVGVTAIASPEDHPDFEWLYYGVFMLQNPQNALRDGPISSLQISIDVRGQRIVRAGVIPFWVAESQTANAIAGVGGRYLVKLP